MATDVSTPRTIRLPGWLRLPTQPLARNLVFAVVGGALLFLITEQLSPYDNFQFAQIGLYAMAIAGLSVLTGASGQISLGNGAFMLVGSYATALMMEHFDLPLILPLLVAAGAAAVGGALIGLPATRLKGPYLAGVTLAVALALPDLTVKWSSVFGGDQGITVNPPTQPNGVDPERYLAWITLLGTVIVMVLLANLMRSRFGRAFRAIRDDEIAASLSGINAARMRVLAFSASAACAGLAGGYLALATGIVNPANFGLSLSISLLAGMVLGGTGTLMGAWWGGVLIVYLPQWSTSLSSTLSLSSAVSANLANVFYGVVLIVVIIFAPSGIQGWLRGLYMLARSYVLKALARPAPAAAALAAGEIPASTAAGSSAEAEASAGDGSGPGPAPAPEPETLHPEKI